MSRGAPPAPFEPGLAAGFLGLPLTRYLRDGGLERPWAYPAAGLAAGAALVLLFYAATDVSPASGGVRAIPLTPAGAVPGCLGGALWWIAYRRSWQGSAA